MKYAYLAKSQGLAGFDNAEPPCNASPYEKLVGNLSGCYSRRINIQHRLVYTVEESTEVIHLLHMWTHYEQQRRHLVILTRLIPVRFIKGIAKAVLFCCQTVFPLSGIRLCLPCRIE